MSVVIGPLQFIVIEVVSYCTLYLLLFIAIYYLLRLLPQRTARWRKLRFDSKSEKAEPPKWLANILLIRCEGLKEQEQRLRAAGFGIHPVVYEMIRRTAAIIFTIVIITAYLGNLYTHFFTSIQTTYLSLIGISGIGFVLFDGICLEAIKKHRNGSMIKEIYAVSNQLLYYSGTRMNLHHKLNRCMPYTRTIRKQWELMINEWYHDPEMAISRFKERLGTDEAYSFAETIRSLRLDESESFYQLLRERIRDYKEKIELAKESKKETVSYALFVLAGLPILNTFRVFIYPWVMESQKLFQTLN